MKKLIANNQISNHLDWLIVNCIHELRIMTAKQIIELISLDFNFSRSGIYSAINRLTTNSLIASIKFNKTNCYYLTKKGFNLAGGLYSFPKVPEYNLAHHLAVTDHIIQSLKQVNDMKEFIQVISK